MQSLINKEFEMEELTLNEIEQVNGGCAQYCWGDFDGGEFAGAIVGGALSGARGGFAGAGWNAMAAGVGYILMKIW